MTATSAFSSSARAGCGRSTTPTAGSTRRPTCSRSRLTSPIPDPGPRELGDVFVCPEQATDVIEAAVHGTLHLCGYDHESDEGEMLALQAKVMADLRGSVGGA